MRPFTSCRQDVECRTSTSLAVGELLEKVEPFLKVEGGVHVEIEAELHNRKGHLRLNANDHGFGSAKARSMGKIP